MRPEVQELEARIDAHRGPYTITVNADYTLDYISRVGMAQAVAYWNTVDPAQLRFKVVGEDRRAAIRFMAGIFPYGELAVEAGGLGHAVVLMNAYQALQGYDMTNVAAHEIGHALGLPHSREVGSLMYPSEYPGRQVISPLPLDAHSLDLLFSLYPVS